MAPAAAGPLRFVLRRIAVRVSRSRHILPKWTNDSMLCGNLLVRELRRARALRSMLDRDGTNVTLSVNVEHGVLVKIPGFGYRRIPELDQQCVRVSEIANLHGVNLRF